MLVPHPKRSMARRLLACGLVAAAASVWAPAPASAHFILTEPAASLTQDNLGNPQKAPPCGDDGGAVASGKVTAYQAGQNITITINETIFHPGHYRISLGVNGPGDIPVEPVVTAGSTACGSAPIDPKPAFPVLADGVFAHDKAFDGPQSITITLPEDVTCDHCTLQVLEFMSNHGLNNPGGCYYHHCSEISIKSSGGTGSTTGSSSSSSGASTTAASTGAGGAASTTTTSAGEGGSTGSSGSTAGESSGCGFAGISTSSSGLVGLGSLVALAALTLRRRRR
jgi:Lytic polysaccharide mono-oxygenase, cellulose-degrading